MTVSCDEIQKATLANFWSLCTADILTLPVVRSLQLDEVWPFQRRQRERDRNLDDFLDYKVSCVSCNCLCTNVHLGVHFTRVFLYCLGLDLLVKRCYQEPLLFWDSLYKILL